MEPHVPTPVKAGLGRQVEATLGAFFAFVVVFVVVLVGLIVLFAPGRSRTPDGWAMLAIVGPGVALECLFVYQLKVALEAAHYPFAPWFALTRRRWPVLLRPVVAAWWAGHFLLGVAAAVLAENLIVTGAATWDARAARGVAFVAVGFTIAYSANLYALLAVAALGGGPAWVNRLWRGRLLLDLGVAVVAATFPFLTRSPPPPKSPADDVPEFVRRHHRPPATSPATAAGVRSPTTSADAGLKGRPAASVGPH